jgi:protein arginine kinase activator
MICKKKEASVHLSQIVGDKMQKFDLCEECSQEKGINDSVGFALADLLQGLSTTQEAQAPAEEGDLRCPHCGFTQADLKKTGRLGCAECYGTFAEALEALLKSMHKGTRHVGKVPGANQDGKNAMEKLQAMQKRLDQAVAVEDFELAAALRDQIKELRQAVGALASR